MSKYRNYTYAEVTGVGLSIDGKPVLQQTGDRPGTLQSYSLRHVTVWALSETAAKGIQNQWRKEQDDAVPA